MRVQPINQPHDGLALEVELLQLEVERSAQLAEPHIVYLEAIKLVAVNRDVPPAAVFPFIVLVDPNPDQMRHDISQSVIVVAFHPHDLDFAFGIRELANVAEELPVFFGQASEIQVGKDVAQQNQPLKAVFLQHACGFARVTGVRTEVQIGKDQRVVYRQIHSSVVTSQCYGVMKVASKLVHGNFGGNPINFRVNKQDLERIREMFLLCE